MQIMNRSVERTERHIPLFATCIRQGFSWPTLARVDHTFAAEKSVAGMGSHTSHLAMQERTVSVLTIMEGVLQKSKCTIILLHLLKVELTCIHTVNTVSLLTVPL